MSGNLTRKLGEAGVLRVAEILTVSADRTRTRELEWPRVDACLTKDVLAFARQPLARLPLPPIDDVERVRLAADQLGDVSDEAG